MDQLGMRRLLAWCLAVLLAGIAVVPSRLHTTSSIAVGGSPAAVLAPSEGAGGSSSTSSSVRTGSVAPSTATTPGESTTTVSPTTAAGPAPNPGAGSSSPSPPPTDLPSPPAPPERASTTTTVPTGPVVTGRVHTSLGLPAFGEPMCVFAFGQSVPSAPVAADGTFHFDDLGIELATGWVLVAQECHITFPQDWSSLGVQIHGSQLPYRADITVLRLPVAAGQLKRVDGTPVAGACILLSSRATGLPLVPMMTRADGWYGPLEALPRGTYDVVVRKGSCIGPVLPPSTEYSASFATDDGAIRRDLIVVA